MFNLMFEKLIYKFFLRESLKYLTVPHTIVVDNNGPTPCQLINCMRPLRSLASQYSLITFHHYIFTTVKFN